jgi:uncharacterized protein YjiS (DUF1127 family)
MEMKMREYALNEAHQTDQLSGHGLLAQLWRNWKAKRAVRRLQDLDDNLLTDIGVTREEINWALLLPLSVNAALELARRSDERRTPVAAS